MCNSSILVNVIIPILCALITGGITFCGVKCTIKAEVEKSKNDYTRRIKPILVIENRKMIRDEDYERRKRIVIHDDTDDNISRFKVHSEIDKQNQLNWILFTNVSEYACFFDYLRVNEENYKCYGNRVIKPGELCSLEGRLSFLFIRTEIKRIAIGISDLQSKHYEFNVIFETKDIGDSFSDDREHYLISCQDIDCRG